MSNRKLGSPGLKVLSLGDLLAHPFPRREHLIFPWLRQGESALVWAASGLGKTMLTLTMALAVAGGGRFLGWHNDTPRRVLVVDGEMHAEDLKDRLALLIPAVDGIDVAAARENLLLLPRQFQGRGVAFPDIADEAGQKAVMGHITKHKAGLVILDNFSTLAEVADENEAGAMNPVLRFLLDLKAMDVATILVHHSGKTGQTFRGSSKLATTFEVILGLKADESTANGTGTAFETEWTKFRGQRHASTTPALVSFETHEEAGKAVWSMKPAESDMMRRVIEAAQSGACGTQAELAGALGVSESHVSKLKNRAIKEGRVAAGEIEGYLSDAVATRFARDPKAAF